MAQSKKKKVMKKSASKKAAKPAAKKPSAKRSAPAKKAAPKKAAPKKSAAKAPVMKKSSSPNLAKAKITQPFHDNFTPLDDRIVVAVEEQSEKTAGGIIIPGNVNARPNRGTVLAKGRGRRGKKGVIRPLDVNVGDHVLFPEFAGTKIQIDGAEFLILREEDLLGVATF